MTDHTLGKWFAKFRAGDFSLDDAPQVESSFEVEVIKLRH